MWVEHKCTTATVSPGMLLLFHPKSLLPFLLLALISTVRISWACLGYLSVYSWHCHLKPTKRSPATAAQAENPLAVKTHSRENVEGQGREISSQQPLLLSALTSELLKLWLALAQFSNAPPWQNWPLVRKTNPRTLTSPTDRWQLGMVMDEPKLEKLTKLTYFVQEVKKCHNADSTRWQWLWGRSKTGSPPQKQVGWWNWQSLPKLKAGEKLAQEDFSCSPQNAHQRLKVTLFPREMLPLVSLIPTDPCGILNITLSILPHSHTLYSEVLWLFCVKIESIVHRDLARVRK